jgi:hypothetical protein
MIVRSKTLQALALPALLGAVALLALGDPADAVGAPRVGAVAHEGEPRDESPARSDRHSGLSLPGPAPRVRAKKDDPVAANAACEGCHEQIASEWNGSMHKAAYVDPVFQEAYQLEPFAFCRGCHAPEADPKSDPSERAQAVGVGCTTCHVQGKEIVGTSTFAETSLRHAVVGDARLATVEACGACHQFDFPAAKGSPMQNTLGEHAASKHASVTCQGCHMKEIDDGGGRHHTSHSFSVLSDPSMIRSAAKVKAERVGSREARVTIDAGAVGHAFPTGDMFRRLEIRAEAVDARGHVIERAPAVHLVRTFADRSRSAGEADFARVQVGDTRVPAPGSGDGRRVLLRFERPIDHLGLRWSVVYQRMGTAMAASFGVEQAHDEIVVAEGIVPAEASP